MSLTAGRVSLYQFRNYEGLDLELSSGIHILAGDNAQGKTNLLEAMYLVSSTRLLRGQKDSEAIREGENSSTVVVELSGSRTELKLVIERGVKKKVFVNNLALPRASDVLGRLPCVCLSSADLALVSGDPSDRRTFLDLELSQLYPSYLRHLAVYKRAVEQRNALLKCAQNEAVQEEAFDTWEDQIALHGEALRTQRRAFIEQLRPFAQEVHDHMGGGEQLDLEYLLKDENGEAAGLRDALSGGRNYDVRRGSTTVGPHRDDLRIEVQSRDARSFGSQGQQRSAMLSIKLGTMQLERRERGFPPLLLLDDILSDLDPNRRERLMSWVLANAGQAVLTCTEPTAAGPKIVREAKLYQVRAGTVTPEVFHS